MPTTIPNKLPTVGNDHSTTGYTLNSIDEIDAGASGKGDLADGAVGEDTQILTGFPEINDHPLGFSEVCMEDRDVWLRRAGRKVHGVETSSRKAGSEMGANAVWLDQFKTMTHHALENDGLTVHGLAMRLKDALILADEEVKVLVRAGNGTDLVALIDEVSG